MAISDEVKIRILTDVTKSAKDLASFGIAIGGVVMAFKKVAAVVTDLTQEYFKQEQAEAKLSAVIKSTGGAAGYTASQMSDMATEMQRTTVFGDDAVMSGQAVMATFTKIGRDVFPQAIEAAADMSTVIGQDLQSSIVQIGKALNDPIEGVSALRRVGVQLTEQQEAQIKAFMESGDIMSAQKIVLSELNTEFGGAAKAMGDTAYGATVKFQNAMGDLKEMVGQYIATGAKPLLEWFTSIAVGIANSDKALKAFEESLKSGPQGKDLGQLQAELDSINKRLATGAEGFQLFVSGAEALSAGSKAELESIKARIIAEMRYQELARATYSLTKEQQEQARIAAENAEKIAMLNEDWLDTEAAKVQHLKDMIALYESPVYDQNAKKVKDVLDMYRQQLDLLTKQTEVIDKFPDKIVKHHDGEVGVKKVLEEQAEILDKFPDKIAKHHDGAVGIKSVLRETVTYQNAMARAAAEQLEILKASAPVVEEMKKDYSGIETALSAATDILSGDMQAAINGILSSFGPEGKLMAAVLDIGQKFVDMFRDPMGLSEGFIDAMAGALGQGDWSSVEEALSNQMRRIFLDAAIERAGLEVFAETLSRAIAQYLMFGTDASRDRMLEAYQNMLDAGQNVEEILAQLQTETGLGTVPQMASGGVVTRPTLAMIGESGPEAVVPLGRGGFGTTIIVHGSLIAERDLDSRVAAAVSRKGRGW